VNIGTEDWKARYDEFLPVCADGNDGQTVREIMKSSGRGECATYAMLNAAREAGRLIVGARQRTDLRGHRVETPVYSIRPVEK